MISSTGIIFHDYVVEKLLFFFLLYESVVDL